MVSMLAWCPGDPEFESWPRDQPSWQSYHGFTWSV